jgi:hypothetical protein
MKLFIKPIIYSVVNGLILFLLYGSSDYSDLTHSMKIFIAVMIAIPALKFVFCFFEQKKKTKLLNALQLLTDALFILALLWLVLFGITSHPVPVSTKSTQQTTY